MAKCEIDCVEEFSEHRAGWATCNACGLGETAIKHVLRPRGFLPCDLLFVGMAPGASEDAKGFPMIGPTRATIDRWILESGAADLRWCIQNLIACMSKDGIKSRDPTLYEIETCRPRLVEFVRMADPGQVILLGSLAQKQFPKNEFSELEYLHLPHPASLLKPEVRDPELISARAICELRRFIYSS